MTVSLTSNYDCDTLNHDICILLLGSGTCQSLQIFCSKFWIKASQNLNYTIMHVITLDKPCGICKQIMFEWFSTNFTFLTTYLTERSQFPQASNLVVQHINNKHDPCLTTRMCQYFCFHFEQHIISFLLSFKIFFWCFAWQYDKLMWLDKVFQITNLHPNKYLKNPKFFPLFVFIPFIICTLFLKCEYWTVSTTGLSLVYGKPRTALCFWTDSVYLTAAAASVVGHDIREKNLQAPPYTVGWPYLWTKMWTDFLTMYLAVLVTH